jgi:hypothetical protein
MFKTTTVGLRAPTRIGRNGRKGFQIMSAPQPSQPAQPRKTQRAGADGYEGVVDGAFRDHVVGTGAPPSAADIEPRELLRYAAGKASDDERTALEDFVRRSRWAYDRVVSLVRSNRPDEKGLRGTIGRRLLDTASRTNTLAIVGQAVLEVEGVGSKSLEDAWKTLEKNGNPKTRAACLIGLGRHEDARKILESQSTKDATWNLLRRVSSAALQCDHDRDRADDEALIALLDAFPSL